MVVYTYLKLLYNYVHNDTLTLQILKQASVFVIPVVNFDGFVKINEVFQ